jgi:group I intron endonuclease
MDQYGEIYCITSPSKKKYIGQCVCILSNGKPYGTIGRWKSHITDAHRSSGGTCRRLNYAIRKYTPAAFQIDVLLVTKLEYLDHYEERLIMEYDTINKDKGYNLRLGGNKSRLGSETRLLMSQAQMGEKNHNYGKTPSLERRQKISDSLINSVERFSHNGELLPKYVKHIDWHDRKGYAIVSHPKCKIKYFVSRKQHLDELLLKCQTFLETL